MKPSKEKFDGSLRNGSAAVRKLKSRSFSPHRSLAGVSGAAKRSIDVILSGTALVLLSPLLAVIAIAVYVSDRGPVFYKQIRIGLDGKPFTIFKFRTMQQHAERDLGPIWAVPGDPRCTRIGAYLRRLGLDELPQLWNVLRNEMSLVGPRPERPEFTREFRAEHHGYELRHTVKPGISGYAQIHGWRGYTSLTERLRHDAYYVHNWSISLDLYVLAMTLIRSWSEKTRQGV